MTSYIASGRANFMNTLKVDHEANNKGNQHDDECDEGGKRSAQIGSTAIAIKEGDGQSNEGKTSGNKVHNKHSQEELVMTRQSANVRESRSLT